jgi:hypothetical protein
MSKFSATPLRVKGSSADDVNNREEGSSETVKVVPAFVSPLLSGKKRKRKKQGGTPSTDEKSKLQPFLASLWKSP